VTQSLRIAACAALLALPGAAGAAPCPAAGATLTVTLAAAEDGLANGVVLAGQVLSPSCEDEAAALATTYSVPLTCAPGTPTSCTATVTGLSPGHWLHRIEGGDGETLGRLQARRTLLLDASAGAHTVTWAAFRSVHTVRSLADALDCSECLRAALRDANLAAKPALIQFAPEVAGSITLVAALPPLAGGAITLDGFDVDGLPHTRSIDAAGLDTAALRIVSAGNHVAGMRLANSGSNSDTLLIEGVEANGNLIEDVAVVGRALQPCQVGDVIGCVLDGVCVVPTLERPRGACGDDGVAIRDFAGAVAANVIRNADIRGAFDKGIKASENGVVRVEASLVTGNNDGGIQATLSGQVLAIANLVAFNRGTPTASGLAANGARAGSLVAGRLDTRGNLVVANALRGISVRSLSLATLRDDFACGNGSAGRPDGVGLAVLDAAGLAAAADVYGLAAVHNLSGGIVVGGNSDVSLGTEATFGRNAIAFNGAREPLMALNFRNEAGHPVDAVGNQWEHCGTAIPCDELQVRMRDVFRASLDSSVTVSPALPTRPRQAPVIDAIEPPFAAAGDLVRIYGSGFDAIEGAGTGCAAIAAANTCRPVRGNCVFVDRRPAEVVAVTPTMLVIRAPFTCVSPVPLATRSRRTRGFGRATFCTAPPS
jgi:hypothetical protein